MALLGKGAIPPTTSIYSYAFDGIEGKRVSCERARDVIIFTFSGRYGMDDSRKNAPKVMEYANLPWVRGIIFNFQTTYFTHSMAEFRELGRNFAQAYPKNIRIAYTLGPGSLLHVIVMSRELKKYGVKVHIRPCMRTAYNFASSGPVSSA